MSLLEVKNLTVDYGPVRALDSVSFNIEAGEIVALIGPNGAGKSTALNAISGVIQLTCRISGQITFDRENIKNVAPHVLARRGLCLVPEGRRVFHTMTVLENLQMGAYIIEDNAQIEKGLESVFGLFPMLREKQQQRAGTLSSGEQQMLAIGRALMLEPKLLLIDEPSIGLSLNYIQLVFNKLGEISRNGTAVLLVEQNARAALPYCDRAYVFEISKIETEGVGKELLKSEKLRNLFF